MQVATSPCRSWRQQFNVLLMHTLLLHSVAAAQWQAPEPAVSLTGTSHVSVRYLVLHVSPLLTHMLDLLITDSCIRVLH